MRFDDSVIANCLDDEWRTPPAVHRLLHDKGHASEIAIALERLARAGKIEHKHEYAVPFHSDISATMALYLGKLEPIKVSYYRKLQPMTDLFVYGPQAHAARAMLEDAGLMRMPNQLRLVYEPHQLRGLDRGMFVIVRGHAEQIPPGLVEHLRQIGMVTLEISDEYARARATAWMQV